MGILGFGKNKKSYTKETEEELDKIVDEKENIDLQGKKISIKVLGEGCEKCDKVNDSVKEAIKILNIDADIEKIEDLIEIVTYGVMSTPGIVINEKVVSIGRILNTEEIIKLIKENI
ncbi:thioredoxin family protein [Peptacetobacter sp.]|uniref:thioredoxin family protein n=1 Tax=Peptacetobacter sp. TaxID=2991975 RepID=UPI002634B218|nr:thioredoxin family protein [Peptacetobacter sp.]